MITKQDFLEQPLHAEVRPFSLSSILQSSRNFRPPTVLVSFSSEPTVQHREISAMVQNKSLVYKAVPTGLPEMGKHLAVETSDFDADSKLDDGSILVKILYISLDPYMRGRLRDPSIKS